MPELAAGAVLGDRFEIAGVLGRGGMATVYLARDRVRDERVALKVLHPHLADQPLARARLRGEVAAAQRIRHPRALVANELFELDGALCLSMPLHPGHTLAEDIETRGPMSADALWGLGASLAGALAEAHRAGVLHRDVAPGNVLIDQAREGMLTDFGLARLDDATRTATTMLGTAGYMAPEVLDGGRAEQRSDLYGLGCVLYLAATGKAAFEASSPLATLKRQSEGAYTPLAELRPDLPAALREQIEALLSRDPAERPSSARVVAEAMERREAGQTKGRKKTKTPESPPPGPLLPAPRLPSGSFAVELIEPHERRHRRQQRQRHERRMRRAGLEGIIEGLAVQVEPAVRNWLGMPPGREPEELLREAVANEAGIPAEALELVPALQERRFRLVEGVSPGVAERLIETAASLGYGVRMREVGRAAGPPRVAIAVLAVLFAFFTAVVGAMHVAGLPAMAVGGMAIAPAGLLLALLIVVAVAVTSGPRPDLPVAYPADLRGVLTPEYARRVATGPAKPTAAEPPREAAPQAPPDPISALIASTGEQLAALEQAIQTCAARLPPPAVLDLSDTLTELRERSLAIERHLRPLATEVASRDPTAKEAAAGRVAARLDRLRTRIRAGEDVDPGELQQLERTLLAHQAELAAAEQDEQRLTRLQAALLEIGAAAQRTRRTLLDEADPSRSVDGLLTRLRAESAHARAAEQEMTASRKAAALREGS